MLRQAIACCSLMLLSGISATYADPASEKYVVIAPQCLLKKIPGGQAYQTKSSNATLALIETNQQGMHALIAAKHIPTKVPCGGFIDVTDNWQKNQSKISPAQFLTNQGLLSQPIAPLAPAKYTIRYPNQVNQVMAQINPSALWSDLIAFSDTQKDQFPDRHANSATGVKAAQWLQSRMASIANEYHRNDVTIYTVQTGSRYKQPSVVVKIGHSNLPGIVIGAHMDTYANDMLSGIKPGADDDGSGSMTLLCIARTVLSSGMHFKKPVYLIWYAAEEWGLVGSGFVATHFLNKKIPVDAVLQYDMTGYASQNDSTLWLVNDYVNDSLTAYVAALITTYVKTPVKTTRCGYACSDHASWTLRGIPSAFPFEAEFGKDNPYIHQSGDTINLLSSSHMTDYAKLGVAFAVELAEPV